MSANSKGRKPLRRAGTPEGREQQLTALAYDLAERQLIDGTASSQTLSHFLKAGSTRERLEHERLLNENLYLSAKIEREASGRRSEEMYEEALRAMRTYQTGEEYDVDNGEYYSE